ncbi:MAG: isoleucine--tRNA ligase [Clostridiales Family XIII bacterium]|jgi:isoleucyl-tRNA synthetase|nr:isoleucine--tRNA ligase [Clostridiales Family XIII bacterium]
MFKKLSTKPIADLQNEQAQAWEDAKQLQRCVEGREGAERFIFFEGPPTANGKPGIHHVIARTLKDSICRHKTMQGYQVPRKAGWDTHGLPVEIEVEKQLGLMTKKDIEEYGIAEFNDKCRESVFKYEAMWRDMSRRMGYLIDLDNPYITLDNNFIETGWWILKKFFDEGLIYEGHKILPYCPRCGTGLASHEVSLGYKEIKTNTITVMFKRKDEDSYFLAWTTTPWTVAANVALTVGPHIDYIKAKMLEGDHEGKLFYVAARLADKVLGAGKYEIVQELKGSELEYVEYEQVLPFVDVAKEFPHNKAFYVTINDYATDEDGTGIVHTAPAFGEDDYNTGRKYKLPVVNPVDEDGKYTTTPWEGRFVLEEGLDVEIIKYMAGEGKIFSKEKVEHNYPFCWRCDTPLIYYSKPSWYIEMTKLKDQLVANNNEVNWFPDYVGEKRFGNWLDNLNDWAISRTRYWGTPIPVWRCPDCGKLECIGSREELARRSLEDVEYDTDGKPVIELHRPHVDNIHIQCTCGAEMTRIPEVMDCWFDSGSMPFAQMHYPFENSEDFFEKMFPADFICEGIDQTRGWFYSLLAVSTFISGKSPYKNVLVNDLILDKHGKKMSKSKGNTVDPFALFDTYGADATRWYLLTTSPAWSPTKFDEDGLKEVAGKFFGTLKNVYTFFTLYANIDEIDPRAWALDYAARPELDRWILSKFNALKKEVYGFLDTYDHMKAVRAIQNFVIEDLSNWYIRRARTRFYAEELTDDKKSVYAATYEVLVGLSKIIAPFAPFIADEIYVNLTGDESVHLSIYDDVCESAIAPALERQMDLVRDLVGLGRTVREKEKIKVRQPLSEVLIDGKYEKLIGDMTELISEELNIKNVHFVKQLDEYMNFSLKPNFKAAGPVVGKRMKEYGAALASADAVSVIARLEDTGHAHVADFDVTPEIVDINISAKDGFAVAMQNGVFTILDTTITAELATEGVAREFISKVQQMRKNIGLEMMDEIKIRYSGADAVKEAVAVHGDNIKSQTLAVDIIELVDGDEQTIELNGHEATIGIEKA